MRVISWISNVEANDKPEPHGIGGLGGWFGFSVELGLRRPHTWADYVAEHVTGEPEASARQIAEYLEALRDSILERRIWEPGEWHQIDALSEGEGVPMFADGKVATFSFRAWGDLLAAVWTDRLGEPYCYLDFYCGDARSKPPDFERRMAS